MGSRDDLAQLHALIRSEPDVAEGLDDYCVLVAEAETFGTWSDAPPRRGEPFAHDGSEHEFCLLEEGAVLLYTPLSDTPHVVVGADLREFLALLLLGNGAEIGGLGYEHGRNETISRLRQGPDPDGDLTDLERQTLARLRESFALVPWPDPGARLDELAALLPR